MATLLAKIKIKAGTEAGWEDLITELVDKTLTNESGVVRYEYWKGSEPLTYYGLLSFVDKEAFFIHQDADYHRTPPYDQFIEAMELEVVAPVEGASPLAQTANPPLPESAPASLKEWEDQTPVVMADWWEGRK